MAKQIYFSPDNPEGIEQEVDISELQANLEAEKAAVAEAKAANDALKASAKAKLIAGEALTEAEADTIVI